MSCNVRLLRGVQKRKEFVFARTLSEAKGTKQSDVMSQLYRRIASLRSQ